MQTAAQRGGRLLLHLTKVEFPYFSTQGILTWAPSPYSRDSGAR